MQIPVNVIAVGNHSLRFKRETAAYEAVADGRRENAGVLGPARAGEKQSSKLAGTRVGRGECRKVPGLAEGFAVRRLERQVVLATGLKRCGVELPERAFSVGHPTLHTH